MFTYDGGPSSVLLIVCLCWFSDQCKTTEVVNCSHADLDLLLNDNEISASFGIDVLTNLITGKVVSHSAVAMGMFAYLVIYSKNDSYVSKPSFRF